jgi:hypothetical protein
MPNYQDAKIYKIVNYDNDDVYVGSTTEPTLARRLSGHVRDYRKYLNGKTHYITSFDVIATGDYDIQLIEAYPCNNKMELHAREGYWIKQMDCVNKTIAGRSKKERYEDNKLKIAEYNKAYREANKDKIAKNQKAYYDENKADFLAKVKVYRQDNKEKISRMKKDYYKANKKAILAKQSQKNTCICGGLYTHHHKERHMKTQKHQSYLNSIDFLQDIHEHVMSIINKYK